MATQWIKCPNGGQSGSVPDWCLQSKYEYVQTVKPPGQVGDIIPMLAGYVLEVAKIDPATKKVMLCHKHEPGMNPISIAPPASMNNATKWIDVYRLRVGNVVLLAAPSPSPSAIGASTLVPCPNGGINGLIPRFCVSPKYKYYNNLPVPVQVGDIIPTLSYALEIHTIDHLAKMVELVREHRADGTITQRLAKLGEESLTRVWGDAYRLLPANVTVSVSKPVMIMGNGGGGGFASPPIRYFYSMDAGMPMGMAPPTAVPAVAKKDDGFNGNCQACGKRIYTSSLFVDHQGGPCRGKQK